MPTGNMPNWPPARVNRVSSCWHGGTENTSDEIRPMTSVGYYAPWFQARYDSVMPRAIYDTLSPRAQKMCRAIVTD